MDQDEEDWRGSRGVVGKPVFVSVCSDGDTSKLPLVIPVGSQELVDFLEDSIGIDEEDGKKRQGAEGRQRGEGQPSSTTSGKSSSSARGESSYTDYTGKDWYKKYEDAATTSSSTTSSSSAQSRPASGTPSGNSSERSALQCMPSAA